MGLCNEGYNNLIEKGYNPPLLDERFTFFASYGMKGGDHTWETYSRIIGPSKDDERQKKRIRNAKRSGKSL